MFAVLRRRIAHGHIRPGRIPDRQIEDVCLDHDGDTDTRCHRHADSLFTQVLHHTRSGLQPERRSPRQQHAMDCLHGVFRCQQVCIPCRRSAAPDITARHSSCPAQNRRASRSQSCVVRISDLEPGNICDWNGFHRISSSFFLIKCVSCFPSSVDGGRHVSMHQCSAAAGNAAAVPDEVCIILYDGLAAQSRLTRLSSQYGHTGPVS